MMTVDLDHRRFLAQDFAILNPMQVVSDQRNALDCTPLVPKGFERHARMMPLLVELRALPDAERLMLLERADQWRMHHDMPFFSALLQTDVAVSRLKTHLIDRMIVRGNAGQPAWLRLHDPRVFRHLRWLLTEEQLAWLMGPVRAWTWYEPHGDDWHAQERKMQPQKQRIPLAPVQRDALAQFEALNGLLRDFADEGEAADDIIARQLLAGLLAAREQGLLQATDAKLYARQQFAHGPDIARLPSIVARLRQARDRQFSYVAACDSLQPHDFQHRESAA